MWLFVKKSFPRELATAFTNCTSKDTCHKAEQTFHPPNNNRMCSCSRSRNIGQIKTKTVLTTAELYVCSSRASVRIIMGRKDGHHPLGYSLLYANRSNNDHRFYCIAGGVTQHKSELAWNVEKLGKSWWLRMVSWGFSGKGLYVAGSCRVLMNSLDGADEIIGWKRKAINPSSRGW